MKASVWRLFSGVAAAVLLQLPLMAAERSGVQAQPASAALNVRDFGAKGDGVTKDTAAIQKAVDAAHAAGGGEVYLGPGIYLSGSVYLKSNVDFHLAAGAVLKGSPDPSDYNPPDVCPQNPTSRVESASGGHLLLCIEQENVRIRGPGKIDGNSAAFLIDPSTARTWGYDYRAHWTGQGDIPWRPSQMVYVVESRNIRIEDAELANSTYWTVFIHGCENVTLRGLYVHNERDRFHTHNGDGIDIDCSRYVTISDCRIYTTDDCITLRAWDEKLKKKRDCAFVTVANCVLSSACNCVRFGVGEGVIHDVVMTGITVHDTRTLINIVASWRADAVKGVDFRNIQFVNWSVDCRDLFAIYSGPIADGVKRVAEMRDILFSGFTGSAFSGGVIEWLDTSPATGIVMRDMNISSVVSVKNAEVEFEGGRLRAASSIPSFNVRAYGAKGDGRTKDTAAIQKAVAAAHAAGGGAVVFDAGEYVTGTVGLESGVAVQLKKGAVLKASADPGDYPSGARGLIVVEDGRDIALRGEGKIVGSGGVAPCAVYVKGSRGAVVEGVEISEFREMACRVEASEKVMVSWCTINSSTGGGILVDGSRNVFLGYCTVKTADDAVTLLTRDGGGTCRDVAVVRSRFSSSKNAVRLDVGGEAMRACRFGFLEVEGREAGVSFALSGGKGLRLYDMAFDAIDGVCGRFVDFSVAGEEGARVSLADVVFRDARVKAAHPDHVANGARDAYRGLRFENCR